MSSGTGGAKEQVDVYLDDDLLERVESQLEYGDSLSGWIRDATRMRLDRDNAEK